MTHPISHIVATIAQIFPRISHTVSPVAQQAITDMAGLLEQGARQLGHMLACPDEDGRMDDYRRIKDVERQGDRILQRIAEGGTAVRATHFGRISLLDLCQSIDDVIDTINNSAKRMAIYNPQVLSGDAMELGRIISQNAASFSAIAADICSHGFRADALREAYRLMHTLENRADDVYEAAIMKLFEGNVAATEIIKEKEILSALEHVTDAADMLGKKLLTIAATRH